MEEKYAVVCDGTEFRSAWLSRDSAERLLAPGFKNCQYEHRLVSQSEVKAELEATEAGG